MELWTEQMSFHFLLKLAGPGWNKSHYLSQPWDNSRTKSTGDNFTLHKNGLYIRHGVPVESGQGSDAIKQRTLVASHEPKGESCTDPAMRHPNFTQTIKGEDWVKSYYFLIFPLNGAIIRL